MSGETCYDLKRLQAALPGLRIEHHAEIASTNDWALTLAAAPDVALPLLVLADRQTAGRGRGANVWWAAPGSITFSLALQTTAVRIPARQWPQLSLVTGLAICEALEQLTSEAQLQVKWPNDVYLQERKICGILIEAPPVRDRLVIGAGLNVNNPFAAAPAELQQKAIALCDFDGERRDLTDALTLIVERLQVRWQQLADDGFASQIDDWRSRCLLTGKTVQLHSGPQTITGQCAGIDEDGALVLQTESGSRRCHAGTVLRFE